MKIDKYEFPEGLYYHKEHAWVKVDGDTAKIGMNDFFLQEAGNIVYIDMPFEGDDITQGEECGKVQSAKWVSKLIAPVSGEVTAINEELENDTKIMNDHPYTEGWIAEIELSNFEEDKENLMSEEAEIKAFIEAEVKRAEEERKKAEGG